MTNKERRSSERVKGHIRIGYGETQVCVSDLTENLSLKGLFLRTPYPMEIGTFLRTEIHYQLRPKGKVHILKLEGKVKKD